MQSCAWLLVVLLATELAWGARALHISTWLRAAGKIQRKGL